MPTHEFSLRPLYDQLNAELGELRTLRGNVDARLKDGVGVQVNAQALAKLATAIAHAEDAIYAMDKCCCNGHNCNINWQEV